MNLFTMRNDLIYSLVVVFEIGYLRVFISIKNFIYQKSYWITMKTYIIGLHSVIAFLICGASQADTLAEIYQQAQENDHRFKAAQAVYMAGQETRISSRSALLPKINAQADWGKSDTTLDGTAYDPSRDQTSDNSTYSIALVQPLFDMNAWYTYQSAKTITSKSEEEFKIAEQSLITRVTQAYFDALQAAENFTTSKAEETALKQQLEQAKQRFEVGLIAITEVHEAQAAYDSSRAERLIAEGAVGVNFDALEVITGHSHQQLAPLADNFPVSLPNPMERQKWLDMTLKYNLELKAASLESKSKRQAAKAAKANHYPTLEGSLSLSKSTEDVSSTFNTETNTSGHAIGISLSVPIYNGGSVSSARRQANQGSIVARENYLQTQRDAMQATRSSHLTITTAVATVNARKQAIVSNQSALEATQAGYEVGTRDLLDVLTAQGNLYAAQRDHVTALYAYVLNSLQLKAAAGVLSADDITDLSKWLDPANPVMRISQDNLRAIK